MDGDNIQVTGTILDQDDWSRATDISYITSSQVKMEVVEISISIQVKAMNKWSSSTTRVTGIKPVQEVP